MSITARQRALLDRVKVTLNESGTPASIIELATSLGVPDQAVESILALGAAEAEVVEGDDGIWFTADQAAGWKALVGANDEVYVTRKDFRFATGLSRTYSEAVYGALFGGHRPFESDSYDRPYGSGPHEGDPRESDPHGYDGNADGQQYDDDEYDDEAEEVEGYDAETTGHEAASHEAVESDGDLVTAEAHAAAEHDAKANEADADETQPLSADAHDADEYEDDEYDAEELDEDLDAELLGEETIVAHASDSESEAASSIVVG